MTKNMLWGFFQYKNRPKIIIATVKYVICQFGRQDIVVCFMKLIIKYISNNFCQVHTVSLDIQMLQSGFLIFGNVVLFLGGLNF